MIEQIAPGNCAYNLPLAFWLDDHVDVLTLRVVLQDLLDRHEELRASVRTGDDGPFVRIAAEPELPFRQVFLTSVADGDLRDRIRAETREPFDLADGPLLRATLYTLGDGRQALLLTVHHLVLDGLSIPLLLTEVERGYRALREGAPCRPSGPRTPSPTSAPSNANSSQDRGRSACAPTGSTGCGTAAPPYLCRWTGRARPCPPSRAPASADASRRT